MLRKAMIVSQRAKLPNEQLHDDLPPASLKVASRRMLVAGQCET